MSPKISSLRFATLLVSKAIDVSVLVFFHSLSLVSHVSLSLQGVLSIVFLTISTVIQSCRKLFNIGISDFAVESPSPTPSSASSSSEGWVSSTGVLLWSNDVNDLLAAIPIVLFSYCSQVWHPCLSVA